MCRELQVVERVQEQWCETAQKTVEILAVDVPVLFSDKYLQSKVYVMKVLQIHFVDDFGHSCCAAETGTHSANFKVWV